jgi:hypothetical protein
LPSHFSIAMRFRLLTSFLSRCVALPRLNVYTAESKNARIV